MSADVPAAFDMLLEAMNGERVRIADAVREAILRGKTDEAQRLVAKTQRLERLLGETRRLQEAWNQLESGVSPAVEQGPMMVREPVRPSDDQSAPELAQVYRSFGLRPPRRRRQPVDKTPEREFRVPILEALEEIGGKGHASKVLEIVYEKMKGWFTDDDLRSLPTGGIRWLNTAQWERYSMVQEGLLRSDSPRGVWEISEAGRRYLALVRQQGRDDL